MENSEILKKLESINEEINFLEQISMMKSQESEEKLEELRTIRHELERGLNYDKYSPAKNDKTNCKES
jgi:hypothetical protein